MRNLAKTYPTFSNVEQAVLVDAVASILDVSGEDDAAEMPSDCTSSDCDYVCNYFVTPYGISTDRILFLEKPSLTSSSALIIDQTTQDEASLDYLENKAES